VRKIFWAFPPAIPHWWTSGGSSLLTGRNMADRPSDEEALFHAARRLPSPRERAEYLRGACGGDPALLGRVRELLRAYDEEQSLGGVRLGPATEAVEVMPQPGTLVGRYRLLEQIGEGGFGTVFMAEQQHPVRRRVALKVIKPGMDTRQVIARFEAERQALALMDHPNIAKVFDAGSTPSGRPYFVMELVKGVPITKYCDQNNLSPRHRLELFVQVCHAVQHAHQKGVIHRDLKPTNILVTIADDRPIPKVIDFGIAKATNIRLTEMTLFTEHRQMVGTPAYMSPEQAEMTGADVDTRSDVYSLGVLLYELLTGTTPFDGKELRSKAYAEIQRIIREVDPPRPSTRISGLGTTLATTAARRRTEPRKLGQLMRGELDWIVMRALEKDRTRRYETANGLATDVRRYLDNEPVSARPASAAYRVRKFASKHKLGFGAASAGAAARVVGIIGTSVGLVRARRQADRATAVSGFLHHILASVRPDVLGGGHEAKVVDLLQRAESMIETDLADQPEAQIQAYYTLYYTYCSLGLDPEALASLGRAYAVIQQSGKEETQIAVLVALHKARLDCQFGGPLDPCERIARTAVERAQRLFGEQHEITLFAYGVVGQVCQAAGKTAEADVNYRRLEEGVRGRDPRRLAEATVGATLFDYSRVLQSRGEFARSEAHCREALKICRAARLRVFSFERWEWGSLTHTLRTQGKWRETAEACESALADLRPLLGDVEMRELMAGYAEALRRLGRGGDAAEVERQLFRAMAALAVAPAFTPAALTRRAQVRIGVGQFNEAAADSARAIELDPTRIMTWYLRGCLLAYLGDEPTYRAHCDDMLKQFDHGGPTEIPTEMADTAKTSLILAGTPHLPRLNTILDRALAIDTGTERAWDQLAKAMAEYRAGQFDACIHAAGEAAAGLRGHDAAGESTANLFAAMAHHRLGRPDKAGAMLDEVARYAEQEKFGTEEAGRGYTVDWLILQVVVREAEALMRGTPPTEQSQTSQEK
jgi:serine/threonine protein kinase